MSNWQPIETAPEGVPILLWKAEDEPIVIDTFRRVQYEYWEQINRSTKKLIKEENIEWDYEGYGATHWMSIPAPPKPENKL